MPAPHTPVTPLLALLPLIALCAAPPPAHAVIGTLDAVPAATLLVPLFEVALDDAQANDTVIALASVDDAAVLTRVTLWSDRGVPVYAFDLALPAAGLVSVRLGDVLRDGTIPATDVAAFPDCDAAGAGATTLTQAERARIRAALTGAPDPDSGLCSSTPHGDQHARGYVTVDVMAACTPLYPGESGYFGAGADALDNRIMGQVTQLQPYHGVAVSDQAIALEASDADPLTTGTGSYTFYGAQVGWDGSDHRESLPSTWEPSWADRGDTELVVWRDPKQRVAPFDCDTPPAPLPSSTWALAFDLQSHPKNIGPWLRMPLVAQSARIDGPAIPVPWRAGLLLFALDHTTSAADEPARAQLWVGVRGRADRCSDDPIFRTAMPASPVDTMLPTVHYTDILAPELP